MLGPFFPLRLRAKIESLLKKGGVLDADAPEDAASIRHWCTVGGEFNDRQKVSQTGTAVVAVNPTGRAVSALTESLGGALMPTKSGQPALTDMMAVLQDEANQNPAASTLTEWSVFSSGAFLVAQKELKKETEYTCLFGVAY